jgi:anaerobic magnesium-protoporphyrin IX monomethyl ester cyclase
VNQASILLINPRSGNHDQPGPPARENLSLGYLHAVLRSAKFPVEFIDAGIESLTIEDVCSRISGKAYIATIIPLMFRTLDYTRRLLAKIRAQVRGPIMGFSYAASLYPQLILADVPALDGVILGEAEQTVLELANRWQSGQGWLDCPGICTRDARGEIQMSSAQSLISDLDGLPFPSHEHLEQLLPGSPVVEVWASRGCYCRCTFCNVRPFYQSNRGPAWRGRSPANIVAEVERLVEAGVRQIEFMDDCFIGPGAAGRRRAAEIADAFIEHGLEVHFRIFCRADQVERDLFVGLRRAGLCLVNLGIESGSDLALRRYQKGLSLAQTRQALAVLSDLNIAVCPSFILFDPFMTSAELAQNLAFLEAYQFWTCLNPSTVIPFQGTALMAELSRQGLLSTTDFLFEGYIPAPRFADSQVGMVYHTWQRWRQECSRIFPGLVPLLEMACADALDPTIAPGGPWKIQALYPLAIRFKRLELAWLREALIQSVRDRLAFPELAGFIGIHHQVNELLPVQAALPAPALVSPAKSSSGC